MHYYCQLATSGIDRTNLQLYSAQRAAEDWNDFIDLIAVGAPDTVAQSKERLTFILSCLGLSLSQLLGQNWPFKEKESSINQTSSW